MSLFDRVWGSAQKFYHAQRGSNSSGANTSENDKTSDAGEESKSVPFVTCACETLGGHLLKNKNYNSSAFDNPTRARVTNGTNGQRRVCREDVQRHGDGWEPETREHIDWFGAAPRISSPFFLDRHRYVVETTRFYSSIDRDIAAGPSGPRARNGALLADLKLLRSLLDR